MSSFSKIIFNIRKLKTLDDPLSYAKDRKKKVGFKLNDEIIEESKESGKEIENELNLQDPSEAVASFPNSLNCENDKHVSKYVNLSDANEYENLEIIQKQSEMKNETDALKSDYNNKLNELEYQKKLFTEEKNYFEKYREEANK